ncbi:SMP-30/gluconolactonase/LRE family protein [Streptomyces sp. NPDC091280]|uniref:SMP-30/gluconolactonase/LRE family protein n=1 Tax=Streptomyces sp. NPDC091280 TaxID=3365984 RepID=UPI00382FE8FC
MTLPRLTLPRPEILADLLGHPETPELLLDGGVLFAETDSGRICVRYPDGLLATFAVPGGRPYGCLFGSDDHVYVTQSGHDGQGRIAPRTVPPSLQRISPDGTAVEVLVTEADGLAFTAPNSLAWDPDGRLWITDSGRWDPDGPGDPGYLYVIGPGLRAEVALELGPTFPNGVLAESDGAVVWVESYTRRVCRLLPGGLTEHITTLPEGHTPEAVKADVDGNLWIANFEAGGIDVIARDGTPLHEVVLGGVPINFAFGEGELYVIDFGLTEHENPYGYRPGQLKRVPCRTAGAPVLRGALDRAAVT